jgi:hypothetical protein
METWLMLCSVPHSSSVLTWCWMVKSASCLCSFHATCDAIIAMVTADVPCVWQRTCRESRWYLEFAYHHSCLTLEAILETAKCGLEA